MSASLVGSEMCIRDRPETPADEATEAPLRAPPRRMRRDSARGANSSGPVSYTHLTLPTICSV
eukprot:9113102-Alexandrium_andersonii.AAC.1